MSYHRTRQVDNIVTVQLGAENHPFAWFLPPNFFAKGEQQGVVRGPIFTLTEPAATLAITPVQFGGGCLSEIPALQERFIILDRVIIREVPE
jgi:hypothetical protein